MHLYTPKFLIISVWFRERSENGNREGTLKGLRICRVFDRGLEILLSALHYLMSSAGGCRFSISRKQP
jgi:hypothetical protein